MNKGKRWTDSENNNLINNILNNKSLLDISAELERSKYAVIKQLEKLLLNKDINMSLIYEELLVNNIKHNFNINDQYLLESSNKESNSKSNIIQDNIIKNEVNYILDDIIYEIEETKDLNKEQLLCYQNIKSNKNLLITGSSGVGKSTILKSIIKYLKRKNKNIGVTSSTGISATLINGTTIHSFLKIGLAKKSAQELYEKIKFNTSVYNKLKRLEVLIIDEISMVDNIFFNKIAAYLSLIKEVKKPFGKIQLILCGDFYQLPPIENTYCFNSNIWNRLNIQTIELKQQMRQQYDKEFQYILEQVKINNITNNIYSKLLELKNTNNKNINSEIRPTILYSKNINVDQINQNEFLNLFLLINYR